jgi:hypothetical protein
MKLYTYTMPPEDISMALFINPSHIADGKVIVKAL